MNECFLLVNDKVQVTNGMAIFKSMSNMYFRKVMLLLISCVVSVSLCYAHNSGLDLNSSNSPSSLHFSDVEFRISGTSNVRDWKVVSDSMGGTIRFGPAFTDPDENSANPGNWIEEVYLYIPNHSLDSGNAVMNQTMNNSLKSETYDKLEYRMVNIEDMSASNSYDERSFVVNGVVSAAGSEHELKHEVLVLLVSEDTFRISGSFDLNMTDLDIAPPTFMRGALTTTDAVKVDYNFTVNR